MIATGEARVEAAVVKAMRMLAAESVRALEEAGWDEAVLDTRWPEWQRLVETVILPVVEQVYTDAYDRQAGHLPGEGVTAAASHDAIQNASKHLAEVQNRVVGVGDNVFNLIRGTLDEGRLAGEEIPKLAARVEATLASEGAATWRNRGRTIARTEVAAAHNAGAFTAARATADSLGEDPEQVVKEWNASADDRTRETHVEANGQQVFGMDTPFDVGGYPLAFPGDPAGPPEEVINCRCWVSYLMPGDPGYPETVGPSPEDEDPKPEPLDLATQVAAYEAEGMTNAQAINLAARDLAANMDEFKAWEARNWARTTEAFYGDVQPDPALAGRTLRAYSSANPRWGTDPAYGINCQNTVTAFDMRMRGYNVEALPNSGASEIKGSDYLTRWFDPATGSTNLLERAKFLPEPGGMKGRIYAHKDIVAGVEQVATGEGKQWGIVYTEWVKGDAHVFNWVKNADGTIEFVDAQTGTLYGPVSGMWRQMRPGKAVVMRTDDLARPNGEGVKFR